MKYKGFMIMCLIIFLFSITSVVASDINETFVANDNQNEEIITYEFQFESRFPSENQDYIQLSEDREILKSLKYNINGTNEDNSIIDGKGMTLDGESKYTLLKIIGNNVTLKNYNFIKGYNSEGAGALTWMGDDGKIINCTFTNCRGWSGGAVLINGKNCQIINSTFTSNVLEGYGKGGAIDWEGSNGTIINSIFSKTESHNEGGAIFWNNNYCNIINCTFFDNHAWKGGAIRFNNGAPGKIINSIFSGNSGTFGSIYGGSYIEYYNCSFTKNELLDLGENCTINRSIFYNNHLYEKPILTMKNGVITNSIFLNNSVKTGSDIISCSGKFEYNWFGNTNNDYKINPNITYSLTKWLFLNVTHELMLVGKETPINFIFQTWDGTTISNYDSSKIYPLELILSATNGEINKLYSVVGEDILYNASSVGNGTLTAKFYDRTLGIDLICKKPTEIITPHSIILYVDQEMNFTSDAFNLILIPNEFGNLTYSTDNETILNVTNNEVIGLNGGIANLIVEFKETDEYASSKVLVPINVIRYDTKITVNDSMSIDYGESGTIDAFLTPYIGSFVYDSDNVNVASVDENGLISSINVGTANIVVKFEGNRKYKPSNKTIFLTVNKVDSSISINNNFIFDYGDSNSILTNVEGANGINAFILNHPETIVNVNNNIISLSNINVGNYSLIVNTIPDNNHNAVTTTANIAVNKIDSSMVIPEITFDYGSSASITPIVNGVTSICDVSVIDHPEANIIVKNNVIEISNLAIGTYTLTATTLPDINHNAVSNTTKVTVAKPDSSIQFTKEIRFDYGSSDTTTVILNGATSITNVNVINHPEAIIDVKNNFISVSGLDEGEYTLTVTSIPDNNHNSVTNTTKITVMKYDSSIKFSNNLIFDFGSSDSTKVVLNGASGITDVKVIDHPEAIINIKDDVINVSGLDAGMYTLTATTMPNTSYNAVTGTVIIQVNKVDSTIKFTKELVFDHVGSDFDFVILNGAVGMDVSVVNYPNAEISCDESSIALFGLDVGSYKFLITTIPDKNHNAITLEVPFKVIKSNPIITVKKGNGYTALSTLKAIVEDGYGAFINEGMVKFSIGGKSYQVKVHDGVGQINVKLPNAKTYSYKATFISDNFNSKTVSSKISVKQSKAKISTKKITSIAGDYFTLKAIVKDSAGKKLNEGSIKFSINGKSYNANVKYGVATKKLKLSNVKTYTYKATFLSKYYKAKVSTSKVIVKKQPVFTVKIGKYSVKISYKDYKKIKNLKGNKYLVKTYYTGKTVDYKIYKDVKQVYTKKKLYSYGTYLTYFKNNPDAMVAPYGYYFAGREFKTENGIDKVYMVYKKTTYKKVLVKTSKTKVYIMVAADYSGASARIYHKISEYTDRYGSFETKEYTSAYKNIF